MDFLRNVRNYGKAVFTEGKQIVFTIFDIIGIIIFFIPPNTYTHIFENGNIIKAIGAGIFLFSFIGANFRLYQKVIHNASVLDEDSITLYVYNLSLSLEMHYFGIEPIKDIEVIVEYDTSPNNTRVTRTRINRFYDQGNYLMIDSSLAVHSMNRDDVYRFYLPQEVNQAGEFVTVYVSFTGAYTKVSITKRQDFHILDILGGLADWVSF